MSRKFLKRDLVIPKQVWLNPRFHSLTSLEIFTLVKCYGFANKDGQCHFPYAPMASNQITVEDMRRCMLTLAKSNFIKIVEHYDSDVVETECGYKLPRINKNKSNKIAKRRPGFVWELIHRK